ncbi:uncharacterized protein SCHCODRAFT_02632678 [Schizophyllum commune H4-8]|uniref:uncharacterized protein n=1 Tax=Schizophyllum commune (strain H4-8 / FGSC 9210) TaxID=578458 RepID=UPI00215E121C|nr:uncharacterized protein SCHCODRAFT_02632678 [Schizophyllum commune H4-8]KAI5890710.1 hypothetical protein SCHCODRAFT_02632678 [Schizophyllum commune H4-8]
MRRGSSRVHSARMYLRHRPSATIARKSEASPSHQPYPISLLPPPIAHATRGPVSLRTFTRCIHTRGRSTPYSAPAVHRRCRYT